MCPKSCSGVVKPLKPNFSCNKAITLSFKNAGLLGPEYTFFTPNAKRVNNTIIAFVQTKKVR